MPCRIAGRHSALIGRTLANVLTLASLVAEAQSLFGWNAPTSSDTKINVDGVDSPETLSKRVDEWKVKVDGQIYTLRRDLTLQREHKRSMLGNLRKELNQKQAPPTVIEGSPTPP